MNPRELLWAPLGWLGWTIALVGWTLQLIGRYIHYIALCGACGVTKANQLRQL